ncbi:hypothetical protein NPJ88_021120, partial [Halomonas elongata]|uniref:hypothetical protein n=1 Tax=Halomonas elongata TaxID=2746 RepID=UPI00255B1951
HSDQEATVPEAAATEASEAEAVAVQPVEEEVSASEVTERDEPQDLSELFSILSDETRAPHKRTVEVVLNERVEEDQLETIAKSIKAMGEQEVERTFIGYRLASQDPDTAYWGTTHYNPELRVNISGLTPTQIEAFRTFDPAEHYEDPIGSWRIERGFNYIAIAYQNDGEVFIDDVFPGEGSNTSRYTASQTDNGGLRLQQPDDTFGEYFIITSQGNLEFWSENGNYYTAKPLNPDTIDLTL